MAAFGQRALLQGRAPSEQPRTIEPANTHARPRILLVDDEQAVRTVLALQISDEGYDVLEAEDGSVALGLLEAHGDIDLLVTDLAMPGMDGIALIARSKQICPELPAILITGYAGNAGQSHLKFLAANASR